MNNQLKSLSFKILLIGVCAYILFIPIMQNPFDPILINKGLIKANSLQISDIILLLISPFGIYQLILNLRIFLTDKYLLFLIIGSCLYLFSLFLGISNFSDSSNFFEFFAACSLVALFYFIIILCISDTGRKYLLISTLVSFIIVVTSCVFGISLFFISEIRINYLIQENPVFPYLGEIVRLTGPFKPTAKLLSTYLTLMIPTTFMIAINNKNKKIKMILLFFAILGIFIYPFTLSRGVSGFIFAFSILFLALYFQKRLNIFFFIFSFLVWIFTFMTIWFASTFHILDAKINLSHDYKSDHSSTVYYYYHPNQGKSNFNFNIDYAYDHYFWLKKSAWEIFKKNINGVGNKSYSKEVKKLEEKKIVPKNISRHPTPQAEFYMAASFYGWFGLASVLILFISWNFPIFFNNKNIFVVVCIGSIFAVTFIDTWFIEITRFRFLWSSVAIFLGFTIFKKKISKSYD